MRHAGVTKGYQLPVTPYLYAMFIAITTNSSYRILGAILIIFLSFLRTISRALFMLKIFSLWQRHWKKVAFDSLALLLFIREVPGSVPGLGRPIYQTKLSRIPWPVIPSV
jgi:hypothetical protein